MKKLVCAFALIILLSTSARAFETDMLNLKMPNQQPAKTTVLNFNHRYYGKIEKAPIAGANAVLGLKYVALSQMEIEGSYTRYQNEYILGGGYRFLKTDMVQSEINVYYFNFNSGIFKDRSKNAYYQLALSGKPILHRFLPVVNIGYDGYYHRLGYGFGLNAGFKVNLGPVQDLNIIGEYYPMVNPDSEITKSKRTFCFGVKFSTYGHNFALMAGNNTEIGNRRLMLGAPGNDLHFGFNLIRKF